MNSCVVRKRSSWPAVLGAAALLLAACGDSTEPEPLPPPVAALQLLSTTSPSGPAGQPLADSVVVRAVDAAGNAVAGATVTWTAGSGGSVSGVTSPTRADGQVAVSWVLGPTAGTQQLTIQSGDRSITLSAIALAGAPHTITITPPSLTFDAIGATAPLTAQATDQHGNPVTGTIVWTSSAPAVADVSASGVVTAVGGGSANIGARLGDAVATAAVSVTQQLARVAISPGSYSFGSIGETALFTADALDANGRAIAGAEISWSTSDGSVVTVDGSGVARSIGAGSAWVIASSGGMADSARVDVTPAVSSIEINPSTHTFTALGALHQFTATVRDGNGNEVAASVEWASSNPAVATVTADGLVESVAAGSAQITASAGGLTAAASVDVVSIVASMEISPASHTFESLGITQQFTGTARDGVGDPVPGAPLTWTSSDPTVATVSSTGLVHSVSNGVTDITVSSGGFSAVATVTVAQSAASVVVTPATHTFSAVGQTQQYTAVVRDANAQPMPGAPVTWLSSDPAIVSITAGGLAEAVAAGSTEITATSGGAIGIADVSVAPVAATVEVTPATHTFAALGATQQFTAVVRDANTNVIPGAPVTWGTTDPAVVDVSGAGLATALSNGTAQITATSGAASGSSDVTVSQVATTVDVTPATHTFTALGQTQQLTAEVRDANANVIAGAPVTWSTDDATIASVSAAGLVTAEAPGGALITATSGAASGDAAITVAQEAATVEVTPATHTFTAVGQTQQFTAVVRDANTNVIVGASVSWASDNAGSASVDGAGLVTAVSNGSAQITATSGTAVGSADVTVAQVATSLTIAPTAATVAVGGTQQFTAEAQDANGNPVPGTPFAWASTDTDVVTVSGSGLATAVNPGVAQIVVSSAALADTADVTVPLAARGFNGSDQAVLLDNGGALTFPDADWSLSMWVRPESLVGTGFQYVFSWGNVGNSPSLNLHFGEAGSGSPFWHFGYDVDVAVTGLTPVASQWHHVLLVREAGLLTLYVDNVMAPQQLAAAGALSRAEPIHLGRRSDLDADRYFQGGIAQVTRWSRALSPTERADLAAGVNPFDIGGTGFDFHVPLGRTPEASFGATLSITPVGAPPVVAGPPVLQPTP